MKFDYLKYEKRVEAKAYWKDRRPTIQEWEEMMKRYDEGYTVIHHPGGRTERIRKQD